MERPPHTSPAAPAAYAVPFQPRRVRADPLRSSTMPFAFAVKVSRPRTVPRLPIVLAFVGLVLTGQGAWIRAKALLAPVLLERAFAQTLATGRDVKPWPWADTWPVARVEFPRLNRSVIALAGASGQALAFGPGHVETTPEPGEPGTAVYAAHRDTHFSFLKEVTVGDTIRVARRDGAVLAFRVIRMSVARFDDSRVDALAPGRHLVLATCWPLDGRTQGPLRYLVHAELVGPEAPVVGVRPLRVLENNRTPRQQAGLGFELLPRR